MAVCQGAWHVGQCVTLCLRSCRQWMHFHGALEFFMAVAIALSKPTSFEWCLERADASLRSWWKFKSTTPVRWRYQRRRARARWRRCERLIESEVVVRAFQRDKIHRFKNRNQEQEENQCRTHTLSGARCQSPQGTRGCRGCQSVVVLVCQSSRARAQSAGRTSWRSCCTARAKKLQYARG